MSTTACRLAPIPLCTLILFTAIISTSLGCDTSDPVAYIGVALPETGAEELLHGVEMYVDEVNAAGGVDGRPLGILFIDDENSPEGAEQAAREFVDDEQILGVVGHFWSSTALGATEVYDEAGLVNIVPVANDIRVTRKSEWVFGMVPPTEAEGRFMANYLAEVLDVDRVVVITETAAYGDGLSSSFVDAAEELDIEVAAVNRFDPGEELPGGFGSAVTEALADEPELAAASLPEETEPVAEDTAEDSAERESADLQPVEPTPELQPTRAGEDAVLIFSQVGAGREILADVRGAGVELPVVVPGAFVEDPTLPEFNQAFDGPLYATSPFLYETGNQQATRFRTNYEQRYGTAPGTGSPMSYDAARLLTRAIEHAGADREAIRDYLANLQGERSVHSVTGVLGFDDHGALDRTLYVTRVDGDYFKVAFTQLVPLDEGGYRHVDVAYVGIDQFRVQTIDPTTFSFAMELFMWVKWRGEGLETDDIIIINGVHGMDDEHYVLQEDLTEEINYRAYRIKSDFLTPFDLRDFPYDHQQLRLQAGHRTKDSTELMLVPDVGYYLDEPVDLYDPEWDYVGQQVYSELYRYPSNLGDPSISPAVGSPYVSSVNLDMTVKRSAFPHLLNAVLPLVLILLLTTIVLWLSKLEVSVRMGIGMTSLLATLVFHMTQTATMPKVGYLTIIDLYFVLAYLAIFTLFAVLFGTYLLRQSGRERSAAMLNRVGPAVVVLLAGMAYAWVTFGATA